MKTVYKYSLGRPSHVICGYSLPKGSEILSADIQYRTSISRDGKNTISREPELVFWACVDTEEKDYENYKIYIMETGMAAQKEFIEKKPKFLCTVSSTVSKNGYVCHVFVKKEKS